MISCLNPIDFAPFLWYTIGASTPSYDMEDDTMSDKELLFTLSNMMDQKLTPIADRLDKIDARLENVEHRLDDVEHRLDDVEHRLDNMEHRLDTMEHRLDTVEQQIKHTEHSLNLKIVESENLILDEVSRVHRILEEHRQNKFVHTA